MSFGKLTHLTAVSGANLILLLAFLLTIARWVGVSGWWLRVVGLGGVIIFIALCRACCGPPPWDWWPWQHSAPAVEPPAYATSPSLP
jgi:hypothetical protein